MNSFVSKTTGLQPTTVVFISNYLPATAFFLRPRFKNTFLKKHSLECQLISRDLNVEQKESPLTTNQAPERYAWKVGVLHINIPVKNTEADIKWFFK